MPEFVLQPHHVAGSYVATPTLDPALHLNGWELDEGSMQFGGSWFTGLCIHIGAVWLGAALVVALLVIDEGSTQLGGS